MTISTKFNAAIALAAIVFSSTSAHGIVTSDASGTHVVQNGAAFGEDLTGVANLGFHIVSPITERSTTVPICSGALISDTHLITAAHCLDGYLEIEDIFSLFPGGASVELTPEARFLTAGGEVRVPFSLDSVVLDSRWPVVDVDLMIVELLEPAPLSVTRYPLYSGRDEIGTDVVVSGFGTIGFGATGEEPPEIRDGFEIERPLRAGLNRLEHTFLDQTGEVEYLVFDFDSGLIENNTLALLDVPSDLGFGADEVGISSGDSGGPVISDGVIFGISVAGQGSPDQGDVTPVLDGSWGELSLAMRTSDFTEFIADATNGEAVFVPEPSGYFLVALGFLLFRHRRPVRKH